jgi:uncharacterized protein DUF892
VEVEHYEIGVYTNLILNARARGRQDVADVLQRNLDNEQQTLRTVLSLQEKIATVTPQDPVQGAGRLLTSAAPEPPRGAGDGTARSRWAPTRSDGHPRSCNWLGEGRLADGEDDGSFLTVGGHDLGAVGDATVEDRSGQLLLQRAPEMALEGPCAELRVEALARQP